MKKPILFIPGPTEVLEKDLQFLSKRIIGHRTPEYAELQKSVVEKMAKYLNMPSTSKIFIFTSSATGAMEAATRNLISKKSLHLINGAFSQKWEKIATSNGKQTKKLEIEWGDGFSGKNIEKASDDIDTIFLTHCETSTGVLSKLDEISKEIQKKDNVLLAVDAVSSFAGVQIDLQKNPIDFLLFGTQKCLALPPGLAFGIVNEKCLQRAAKIQNRGHYFDFLLLEKSHQKFNTPVTPPISQLFATEKKLEKILEEGENRFLRHQEMQKLTENWAEKNGFSMFSKKGFRSPTVSTINNDKKISIAALNNILREKYNLMISNGYGQLKEKVFRIGHMGEHTPEKLENLFVILEKEIKKML